ncbi:hypothetical protein BDQ12DRAFT_691220 [Crucibulum laeve]|uniref:DUF6533 domain-containing protein n=1 Tax=Crucibulum laeve TaxID=68775 RepID=A0A5C3LKX8_9AGAR|nr:hypothetical protein BDQ12DRAFT_691220 [Crucibulum laeve]
MSFADIIEGLYEASEHIQITRYAQLASSSIILYEHLITLDSEVELIWKSSWSAGKALFLINRYYSLFSVIFNNYAFFSNTLTDSFCRHFFQWQGWTGLLACMIAEIILQMRLYALYSLNKKVLVLMSSSFIIASAAAATIMGSVLMKITASAVVLPGTAGMFCVPSGVSDKFYTFWIPMLAFETLLCALALVRGFQSFTSDGPLFRSGRHLVSILIRDSVLYFLVICATYLTCLLVWISAPTSLLEVPIGFSVAMSCVLTNRVVLNVRSVSRDLERSKSKSSSQKPVGSRRMTVMLDEDSYRIQEGSKLTDIEMAELRSMRAESPDIEAPFTIL